MANISTAPAPRLAYIDNLRSTMIFLVVAMHAAVTYSHFGSWYYNAAEPIGTLDALIFGLFQSHLQAFFMGLLFLVAGYFTPTAYDRKGFGRFLLGRIARLGLPSLLYVFVIHIAMGYWLLRWYGDAPFWPSYVHYITDGYWIDGTGPMWFAVALLVFSSVYALFRLVLPRLKIVLAAPTAGGVLAGALAVAALTFLARTVWPLGTAWHNMQFGYFAQYVVLFAVGILARRGDWLTVFPAQRGYRLLIGSAIVWPLFWLIMQIVGTKVALGGGWNGGWCWQSAVSAVWEQTFGVTICAGLLVLYREKFNTDGRLSRLMSANSFGIYMFHPPVLVAVSLAMVPLAAALPPLGMFVLATLLAFAATVLFVHLVARRIPLLKSIL